MPQELENVAKRLSSQELSQKIISKLGVMQSHPPRDKVGPSPRGQKLASVKILRNLGKNGFVQKEAHQDANKKARATEDMSKKQVLIGICGGYRLPSCKRLSCSMVHAALNNRAPHLTQLLLGLLNVFTNGCSLRMGFYFLKLCLAPSHTSLLKFNSTFSFYHI